MAYAPLAALTAADVADVRVVLTDIDDTLTDDGRLGPAAYAALWRLQEAGFAVVPVTGRPAGWCDHFARMWPVAGVVGENGALAYAYDPRARRMSTLWATTEAERAALPARRAAIAADVLREVPRARVASDQPFRIHDLAIDFAEDVVPALDESHVDHIVAIFERHGATAKVSSIHVNGWFGTYDKLSMIHTFARTHLGLDLATQPRAAIYAGDSPNDAPAFAAFPLSVGVANVRAFAHRLATPPRYVTPSPGGHGFAELADALLALRGR